jgi:hypothetical protein
MVEVCFKIHICPIIQHGGSIIVQKKIQKKNITAWWKGRNILSIFLFLHTQSK